MNTQNNTKKGIVENECIRNSGYPVRDRMLVEKIKPHPSFSTLFLFFLLWVIPFTLSGQRYITGRITDAGTGEPIIGASVFIANTTAGSTTDADGNYRLAIPGEGSYRLTVSHVGYQPVFRDIDPGKQSLLLDVTLNTNELEEVTISVKVRFRARDINLFWRSILGKLPSKNTIYALNPEAVYYYYNSETRILKVTCREPLHIINNETGYHVQLVVDQFTYNYNTGISSWRYEQMFTELEPENTRQKTVWEENRNKVYQVSLNNFIKALYHNTLMENGYLLTYPGKSNTLGYLCLEDPATLLSIHPVDNTKSLHIPTEQDDLALVCFGRPVTQNTVRDINRLYNEQYLKKLSAVNFWRGIGLYRNVLKTLNGPVQIFPDGTYRNQIAMSPLIFSNPITGLDMMLPVEYIPEVASGRMASTSEADVIFENELVQRFNRQLSVFPQEKIHLHTDRDFYVPGEKIWFKAYVTDAHTHLFPTYSQYVYVELISPADTLVNRVMINQTDDMLHGHLPLTDKIPEGNYTLRAYTRYMENLGDDYFFKKNIRIGNLAKNREDGESSGNRESRRSRENQKNQKNQTNQINQINHTNHSTDIDVSFFPEGGHLLEGVFCKVAFKALNKNGYPEPISGKLLNEKGEELASVETFYAGMGILGYIPEAGKRIYLKCSNSNGLVKQFELPRPNPRAYSLTASLRGKRFLIGVQASIHAPDVPCYLLAHCRGEVLYFAEWDKKQTFISFMEDQLPAGVIQFVLFDQQMNPLSERLVFNKNDDATPKLAFQTDKEVYEKREKVIVALSPSLWGRAGVGLSVAITDDNDISVDDATTILSSLLLSSELKGYIENPAYYLQDNPESATALDYLMMTHGWRRYNVPEVVKGNIAYPQILYQTAQEISGNVKSLLLNNPVAGSEISLVTKGEARLTSTDRNGSFTFEDLVFPDSTAFFIQAFNGKGNRNIKLEINEPSYPKPVKAPQTPAPLLLPSTNKETALEPEEETKAASEDFLKKAEQRAMYDDDIRLIHIEEVVISAPRKTIKRDDPRQLFYANQSSDATLGREVFEKIHFQYNADYLNLATGIRILPNGAIRIRDAKRNPLVFIDGVEQDWPDTLSHPSLSPLERVSSNMIESIDIFKGFGAVMFGMRGANGVISITTKRGEGRPPTDKTYHAVYAPLGYQKPVEFYSPKYETQEAKWSAIPDYRTTIFWKPDIVISDDEEASFEFYTSDFKTTYSVVIEGITADGRIVRQVEKIRVE